MSENEHGNITPLQPYLEEQQTPPPRKNPAGKIIVLAVILFLLILLVCLLIFREHLSPAELRRTFAWLRGDSDTVGLEFPLEEGSAYVPLQGGLATVTPGGIAVYSYEGERTGIVQHVYDTPLLLSGDRLALACDVGGSRLTALSDAGIAVLDLETDGTLLDADISTDDAICYAELLKGYRTVVTVYDEAQNQIYRWYSNTRYMNQCAVSEKGTTLCTVAMERSGDAFSSTAVIFRTDEEEPHAELPLGDSLIWELDFVDSDTLCAIGENGAVFFDTDGREKGRYELRDGYLKDYSLCGFLTLSVNKYQSGSRYSLVTVNRRGEPIAETYIGEEIISVSALGNGCAALTASHLYLFDQNLTLLASEEELFGATAVVMQEDGTALLIRGGIATRIAD